MIPLQVKVLQAIWESTTTVAIEAICKNRGDGAIEDIVAQIQCDKLATIKERWRNSTHKMVSDKFKNRKQMGRPENRDEVDNMLML